MKISQEEELKSELQKVQGMLEREQALPVSEAKTAQVEVLKRLSEIKCRWPTYFKLSQGHLVDFFIAEALFRDKSKYRTIGGLEEIALHLRASLRVNPDFSDALYVNGERYMMRAVIETPEDVPLIIRKAVFNLERAKEVEPSIRKISDHNLSLIYGKFGVDVGRRLHVRLCDSDRSVVRAWESSFEGVRDVSVVCEDIFSTEADSIVSPANSRGFMDGGIDYHLSRYFKWSQTDPESNPVTGTIKRKWKGNLPVGKAEIVPTGSEKFPYLICAPTMSVPMDVRHTINAYNASRGIFQSICDFNRTGRVRINSVVIPGLCTGTGNMDPGEAAKQMKQAHQEYFPENHKR